MEHQDEEEIPPGSISNQDELQDNESNQDPEGNQGEVPPVPPFVINGQCVPKIGNLVFQYLDRESLINCRAVSKSYMTYVDTKTQLWSKKSLISVIKDNELDESVRLEIVKKILEKRQIDWRIGSPLERLGTLRPELVIGK